MRRLLVVAAAAGSVVAVAIAVSSAAASSSGSDQKPGLGERRILRIAETSAARAGDPRPMLIQHSEGTRHDANRVDLGELVPGGQWSYLIAERGRFVLEDALRPARAHPRKGSVLTLVVDASTGETTDSGLSNRYPDLARLGPVHTDVRQASAARRSETFVSLWPGCGCAKRTELDAFSLSTGRRLRRIAPVRLGVGERVAPPAAVPGGPVLLAFSSGPECAPPPSGGSSAGPCQPLPDSCTGRIERVNPDTGTMSTLLAIEPSTLTTDALPSPRGHMVVMRSGDCDTSYFDLHLVVRDLRSGHEWSIGADAPRCHEIGQASWSPDGSKLVFPYGPSVLPYGTKPSTAQQCNSPGFGRLVVVRADRASSGKSWRLIAADKHCSFMAAAFDRQGIAAVERCQHGPHGFTVAPFEGFAYLLQLDHRDHVVARLALEPGWEEGLVSTDFRDGSVIVSQDQPANSGYPERDWVWQFDGHHLRAIAHYSANDAAQIIAAPW